jgi:hypothetical protein
MDMRFFWIRDRVQQGQFIIYWRKGKDNDADYFTKQHPTSHHRALRQRFLHIDLTSSIDPLDVQFNQKQTPNNVTMRGCVDPPLTTHVPDTANNIETHQSCDSHAVHE